MTSRLSEPVLEIGRFMTHNREKEDDASSEIIDALGRCLSPASFWPVENIVPNSAWLEHAPFAFWLMDCLRPRTFVELGTNEGFSYFAFCQAAHRLALETKCYAVDTWQGDEHAGYYGDEVFSAVKSYNDKYYSAFSDLVRSTFDKALSHFVDGSIDLLHIDGRHLYEDVKHDFEAWRPKLSNRAVVLFHDTNVRERDFGVFKLWEQLSSSQPSFEFHHGHGLGVLGFGREMPRHLVALFDSGRSVNATVSLRTSYARLGSAVALEAKIISQQQTNASLNSTISEDDSLSDQLKAANVEIDFKSQRLREREEEWIELSRRLSQLESVVSRRDNEILAIRNSMSWRITAPYRSVANRIRRMLNLVSRAAHVKSLGNDYDKWLRRYGTLTDIRRSEMLQHLGTLGEGQKISIVMPVYNPHIGWLREAIDSVINQIYRNWELCIADDKSTNPEVLSVLAKYQEQDARIKVVFREKNGHISAASNTALDLATGDWIALLDQDDLLSEEALYYLIEAMHNNPHAEIIYSDEDKLDEVGSRFDPYFKCDWNPDLFLSHNMICHLGVYKRELVETVGRFREGYEGSQDYDLALRCIEQLRPDQVVHVPRVLYHWRSHAESTAQAGNNKHYALLAGQRALDDHFRRNKIEATAVLTDFGMYRVKYILPSHFPLASLIIPTRNGFELLKQCVNSIFEKTKYENFEIIIVDNNSDDIRTLNYLSELSKLDRVRIFRDERPFNYSAINNRAVREARGEYVGLINNDIEVIAPEWLSEMVSIASQPGVGAVGARLWYPNDTLQHGGIILGVGGVAGHSHKGLPRGKHGYFSRAQLIQTFSAVTAACLIIKKEIFLEVGGLNEIDLKIAFNDVDFCIRVREAGYRNVWTPYAELYHHESASRGLEDSPEKLARFEREIHYMQDNWESLLRRDPAYSPNLTLDREDFSLAWPPRIHDEMPERRGSNSQ